MLYQVLKIYVRFVSHLFFHSVNVDKKELLKTGGPLLIASNHPNSFLDAIIFDILFDIPVTSLARGDAFKNKRIFHLLRSLKMLPVYRIREGTENLNINYETFDSCIEIFRQKEGVLIFSEGLCVNEWHLRPLKKGTARLAFKAWDENIPLKILPAGVNYSSFRKYGKKVIVNFGNFLEARQFETAITDGEKNTLFNKMLKEELQPLVFKIDKRDRIGLENKFGRTSTAARLLLALPALTGAILHAPVYLFARLIVKLFFSNTDHHDSVMFGVLLLSYPFYIVLLSIIAGQFASVWGWAMIVLLPITAFCCAKYEVRKG
ncbi:MAG TPA: 1-acyl-sn-glycerol-3-phosphate acyltransferase [Niabella sp.]|nr:1-acyl-sn-glycerol-3-phosphate acyltransferase [Niabella sp.]